MPIYLAWIEAPNIIRDAIFQYPYQKFKSDWMEKRSDVGGGRLSGKDLSFYGWNYTNVSAKHFLNPN